MVLIRALPLREPGPLVKLMYPFTRHGMVAATGRQTGRTTRAIGAAPALDNDRFSIT